MPSSQAPATDNSTEGKADGPTAQQDPVVVRDLRLRYPETGRVVLHGVDLRLRPKEIKLLVGPSGSGKSSLALTLNGLIPHELEGEIRGEVRINGLSTEEAGVPWLASQVGMLFQDPDSQLATLTVADEVAFGMENLRVPLDEMPSRIAHALELVGLETPGTRGTDTLSGGQKQRLVMASTLAMGSSILVLDEPTANLDPEGTREVFGLLAQLQEEGASILIIEHKLDFLIGEVDRLDVLSSDGTIAASGGPRDVLRDQRQLLDEAGVWLPQVCELANALADRAVVLEPYPTTIDEAVKALNRLLDRTPEDASLPARSERSFAGAPYTVEVSGLTYSYPDGTLALNEAAMHVPGGDFYVLLGPNGSGKTTLAKHLVGLLRSKEGQVQVAGQDVAGLSPQKLNRLIGYVFQNPEHQFVALTVYDEVAFSLRAQHVPEGEVRLRVQPLLEQFGLAEYSAVNPYKLSQGQKRRLSVATVLAVGPSVLVLDEPTFGQDRANAVRIMEELCELNRRGVTIVVITHDMKLVANYAHRVGVMLNGRMAFEGSVPDLLQRDELLKEARLEPPPLYTVSQVLRESHPWFPLITTTEEFTEVICALSDTCRETASSTV